MVLDTLLKLTYELAIINNKFQGRCSTLAFHVSSPLGICNFSMSIWSLLFSWIILSFIVVLVRTYNTIYDTLDIVLNGTVDNQIHDTLNDSLIKAQLDISLGGLVDHAV